MHPYSLGLLAAQRHADLLAEAQHQRLVRSIAEPKTHLGHVFAKLGLRDRVQAVVFAYEAGIVRPRRAAAPGRLRPPP
jgi:hypothetical protein